MTDATVSRATRRRTIALWCSIIGLVLIGVPLVMLLVVALSASGENALAGVVPLFLLMFTSWIPLVLGIVALVFAWRAERRTLPLVLSIVVIVAVPIGFVLAFAVII